MKLLSLDIESNGLLGEAFIVSAIVADENLNEVDRFVARVSIDEKEIDPWVAENVIPKCVDIPITHDSYGNVLKDFTDFWEKNEKPVIVAHMPFPVETKFMLDCYKYGYLKDTNGYYGLFTLEISLATLGYKFDSLDDFVSKNKIKIPMKQNTHNPTYDALVALFAFKDIADKLKTAIKVFQK